jgi:hypothetical protein
MRIRLALAAIPALVAGCTTMTTPWSEVTGERFHLAIADREAVNIVSVGGTSGWASGRPTMVEPGTHRIVVESLPRGGFRGGRTHAFTLTLAPCKRYYVNAQFAGAIGASFEPVVDEVESIAGCGTRKD